MYKVFRSTVFSALIVAGALAHAQVTASCSVANGATIKGEQVFVVTAKSAKSVIADVEFYVNGNIYDTDDSNPYEFTLDTIAEKEGPISVKILAFDQDGARKEIDLKLTIDNDVAKGADFHVNAGNEALTAGKFKDAVNSGRVALKATPKYMPARMLLARANMRMAKYDAAQAYCEDILAVEPNNLEALELKAAVSLQRAFNTTFAGPDATADAITKALSQAATARFKFFEKQIDGFGAVTSDNRLKYADLCTKGGRFSLAIRELEAPFRTDPKQTAIANRLLFAQIRANRVKDMTATAQMIEKRGAPDAASWIMIAIVKHRNGDPDGALNAEKEAIRQDSSDLTVRSGQIALALMRNRADSMGTLVRDLVKDEDNRYESLLYRSFTDYLMSEFESSKKAFQDGVLAEPLGYDLYIQRANQLIRDSSAGTISKEEAGYLRKMARGLFEAARAAKPDSAEAITGLAILTMIEGEVAKALALAETAVKAGSEYAAAHYFMSYAAQIEENRLLTLVTRNNADAAAFRASGQREEEAEALKRARAAQDLARQMRTLADVSIKKSWELDKSNLNGRSIPDIVDAWRYYAGGGRSVVLIFPR